MKKTILALTAALMVLSPLEKTIAQDFYNGQKGPRATQIDNYSNFTEQGRTYMTIPKLFTGHLKGMPDLLFAAPFSISEKGKVENKGINAGYINENKHVNTIAAFGLFKDGNGKYRVINPQLYLNRDFDKFSMDAEFSIPTHLKTGEKSWNASITPGYGMGRFRIGGSVIKQKGQKLQYQGNIRFEITKDHKYWAQIYTGKKHIGLRAVINLGKN